MLAKQDSLDWIARTNIYEVNIRQYTPEGTFKAFSDHLERLKEMGVETIWLMPITPIASKNRLGSLGSYYACSSYVGINPEFGSLYDFKCLVDKIHELGMKVIIDWVANHTGYDHEWAVSDPSFYLKDEQGNFIEKNGWKDVIDLDHSNPAMQEQMIAAMRFWVKEFDIDGFRCDMAHLVPLSFWKMAKAHCDALKPLLWLAETEEIAYHQVFHITYAWQWMHVTEKFVSSKANVTEIHNTLHDYSRYPPGAYKLFFTSNHDENSWNGTELEKYGGAAKSFSVLSVLWKNSVPLIYSGQEIPNKKRLKFFDKDPIDWSFPISLGHFYKLLLGLRQSTTIAKGHSFNLPTSHDGVLAFLRHWENNVVLVILNLSGNNKLRFRVDHELVDGEFKNLFSGFSYAFKKGETFELMAYDHLVYHNFTL